MRAGEPLMARPARAGDAPARCDAHETGAILAPLRNDT
jgi:hypothetical protein